MTSFRITLAIVLLSSLAYVGYAKTRPAASASTAPQQKPQLSIARTPVQPTPVVQPVASTSTDTAPTQQSDDREKLDQEIIARAKAANVSELEKGMPEQPFGDWLESNFAGKAKISWEVNDCGENDGSGHQDELPVCAEADLNFPKGEQIGISVAVASVKVGTGIHTFGPAGLFNSFFTNDNKKFCSTSLDRLAQWARGSLLEPPCTPER